MQNHGAHPHYLGVIGAANRCWDASKKLPAIASQRLTLAETHLAKLTFEDVAEDLNPLFNLVVAGE
jgi:hypothetical protein